MLERKQLRWDYSVQSLKKEKCEILYIGSAVSAFKSGGLQSALLMVVYIWYNYFSRYFHLIATIASFMADLIDKRLNRVMLVGVAEVQIG